MIKDSENATNTSLSALVRGIFTDAAHLFALELDLARIDIWEDIRRAQEFLTLLVLGLTIAAIGLAMVLVMAALLVNAGAALPLWACFGIVGGITFVVGAGFIIWANSKKAGVDFIPQRVAEAVKQDIQWISSSIKTSRIEKKHGPHWSRR